MNQAQTNMIPYGDVMEILLAEYKRWNGGFNEAEDEYVDMICIGAIGALANVIAAVAMRSAARSAALSEPAPKPETEGQPLRACVLCGKRLTDTWVDPAWSGGPICLECEAKHEPKASP